jgi:hypothetical protein
MSQESVRVVHEAMANFARTRVSQRSQPIALPRAAREHRAHLNMKPKGEGFL